MGLIAPTGVVGEVIQVGEHHATVISVLNKRFKVNAKIYRRDINGTLAWPGPDLRRAKLEYVPIYHKIALGDTIVTSGYSTLFPEGLVIGQIENIDPREPDGFFDIEVRLSTDFQRLDNVYLVRNTQAAEINRMKANFP
jgi:rod shape-determining protein MreC